MTRATYALISASLINLALGTFYAWSVFVAPLEDALSTSRSEVAGVFSLATVFFVTAMLLGPALHGRVPIRWIAATACGMAAAGLLTAGSFLALPSLFFGYGVLFGTANGLGYGIALHVVSVRFDRRRGLATGFVVMVYALGAMLSAPLLQYLIPLFGVAAVLAMLALILIGIAGVVFPMLAAAEVEAVPKTGRHGVGGWLRDTVETAGTRLFGQLWLAYALGAGAGLMMIGHAAGLMEAYGASAMMIAWGPILVSLGNGIGRVTAGWLGDLIEIRWVLTAAGGAGAGVLILVYLLPSPFTIGLALAVMGGSYGLMAAGYPVAVSHYYGPEQMAPVYGRLFTAWGVGGVFGPLMAGRIYDLFGGYDVAILTAAAVAGCAMLLTACLPQITAIGIREHA